MADAITIALQKNGFLVMGGNGLVSGDEVQHSALRCSVPALPLKI